MELLKAQLAFRTGALETIEQLRNNIQTMDPTGYGPMSNTGRAENSLQYEWLEDGKRLRIYSSMPGRFNYIMTLEHGRKPGKMPPPDNLLQWVKQRNIQPIDITQESLAFLIARKIGKEGTALWRKGGHSGIISEVQQPNWIEAHFMEPIAEGLIKDLEQELNELFLEN